MRQKRQCHKRGPGGRRRHSREQPARPSRLISVLAGTGQRRAALVPLDPTSLPLSAATRRGGGASVPRRPVPSGLSFLQHNPLAEAGRPARPRPGTRGSLEFFIPSGVSPPRHARKPASRGAERSRSALLLSLSPALRPRLSKIKCQDLTLSSFRFRKRVLHGPAGWEEAGQGKQGEMRVINLSGRTHACTETHT